MFSYVSIKRQYAKKLPYPYSECRKGIENTDSILVKSLLFNTSVYRQFDCFQVCFQRYVNTVCECQELSTPKIIGTNYPPCLNFTQFICDFKAFRDFFSKDVKSLCENECPVSIIISLQINLKNE